jgi:integrase
MTYKRGKVYYIDKRWIGYPRLNLSTDTPVKARADDMERMLLKLRDRGRRDLIGLLADRRLKLPDLYDAWERGPDALLQVQTRAESPRLGDLVDKWLKHIKSPAGISPRTKRRYAPQTVRRYRTSWDCVFNALPKGKDARLSDLTKGFLLDYRCTRTLQIGKRKKSTKSASTSTLNRDMIAIEAFLSWVAEQGYAFVRPEIPKEREPQGRMRWLSSDEITAFRNHCHPEWWPFFATLFYTGARYGEAAGLRGCDILLSSKRITLHESERRLKSARSTRDLPIPALLEKALAAHITRVAPGPADLLFPDFQSYDVTYDRWQMVTEAAGIAKARMHDARHTFGVHAAMSGVPLVRIQQLMGHKSPHMTMRYMKHAPEAYMDADSEKIADSMAMDAETRARIEAARKGMKQA